MNHTSDILLIDGDIVGYKVASACEEAVHWGNDLWTLHADEREARNQVDLWIETILMELRATKAVVYLSDKQNFRAGFFPEYKAQRKSKRKPMVLNALREHMTKEWDAVTTFNMEADDLLGIDSTQEREDKATIVSIDKDFRSIPGFLYNPDKPEDGIVEITEEEANDWHLYQTLVGDASDNYKGCPSVGPKKAEQILEKGETYVDKWDAVCNAFDKAGLSSKHALTQARVARILRNEDYDNDTGAIKLWNPPK